MIGNTAGAGDRSLAIGRTSPIEFPLLAFLSGVSLIALPQFGAAASCSTDGDTRTCTGEITEPLVLQFFNVDDDPVLTFNVDELTNTGTYVDTSSFPVVFFTTSGSGDPTLNLNFNLDEAIDFSAETTAWPFFVATSGDSGSDSSDKSNAFGTARASDAGDGSGGGSITSKVSSTSVTAESTWTVQGVGGDGGDGGEGKSTGFGDGYGGDGGDGGDAGLIEQYIKDVTVSGGLAQLTVEATGGDAGSGGEGRAADYTGAGGDGGTGGDGGSAVLILEGDNTFAGDISGIVISSTGGDGGDGGEGKNTLTGHGSGGDGGTGGDGGSAGVSYSGSGSTTITGASSGPALLIESVAGDGGDGGDATSGGSATGGSGGVGGNGGTASIYVDTEYTFDITTTTDSSSAVLLRSYGGAGGDGGSANGVFGSAKGGAGSGAGNGEAVYATLAGTFSTSGDDAAGVIVQSVGGFSGDGGDSSAIVAYGSSSQSAGDGGFAEATFDASTGTDGIFTTGDHSDALFVQSVGGGGGKGSSSSGIVSLSGTGSAGGDAGAIQVTTAGGSFTTTGDRSRGVVGQSVGGGGGDGGSASAIVSVGGAGSNGGTGGYVQMSINSDVTTDGDDSAGIFAQSVGGGGGSASSTSGIGSFGGNGGSGATSDSVLVESEGAILTKGDNSDAIYAQSIGGGGGHGSNAVSASADFSVAMGGDGGTGNDGGQVLVYSTEGGSLTTKGDNSSGIVASSTGGGGGNAGNAVSAAAGGLSLALTFGGDGGAAGDGDAVLVNSYSDITTSGENAMGIAATSVGGGGGNAGTTVAASEGSVGISVAVGGDGSGGGAGGAVTVCNGESTDLSSSSSCYGSDTTSGGEIETSGSHGHGIYAASTGGGGGHSGVVIAGNLSIQGVNVGVGGDGGSGGAGDDVYVYNSGYVHTTGSAAQGILAKSVGGSGGASYATGSITAGGSAQVSASIGGDGGDAGNSGDVTVIATGDVRTGGDLAGAVTAVSVAGSGGTGGVAFTGSGIPLGSVGVSVGGAGGGGGTAGDVSVTVGLVSTSGDHAAAVTAMSVGGSGGVGGYAMSGAVASAVSADISIGGKGGAGGTAGTVTADITGGFGTTGSVFTLGDLSPVVVAMSLGGNGGLGGAAMSSTLVSQGSVNLALGGGGGTGGDAASVDVTLSSNAIVASEGIQSIGLHALSQGGNGGAGGFALTGGISAGADDGYPSGSVSVAVGGDGGAGGSGAGVTVTSDAEFETFDFGSTAILAQSIGGDGGAGGSVYSGTVDAGTSQSVDVTVDVGGTGGDSGSSSNVSVTTTGSITTYGDNADAVMAQSVGGNGGAGGSSYNVLLNAGANTDNQINSSVIVGGAGGNTTETGDVSITNSGAISTAGTSSAGLYAQSIGGNGGKGGSGGTAVVTLGGMESDEENQVSANLNVSVGGSGGSASEGGSATITNSGVIATTGTNARGIFAQSVGGGGGDGGAVSTYSFSFTGVCDLVFVNATKKCNNEDDDEGDSNMSGSLQVEVGGGGGTGNDGGTATITNKAQVSTTGDSSHAVMAQSIGGGGGAGGASSDDLSAFTSSNTASNIEDYLDDAETESPSDDPTEQWTDTDAWTSLDIFIGGTGGAGGDGGTAKITNTAAISTEGSNAYGIFAQSVGAGGGSGGEAAGQGSEHTITVGGSGGGAGSGGTVKITNTGASIATSGTASLGVFGQTVGGGGGNSGNQTSVDVQDVSLVVGGSSGQDGDGGAVTIANTTTDLMTGGLYSIGILGQSVGGGGGTSFGGWNTDASGSVTVTGNGTTGDGGAVTISHTGDITTTGASSDAVANAHGIVAQSIGGGGGMGGAVVFGAFDTYGSGLGDDGGAGDGGDVTVSFTGDLTTTGDHSVGILAQSIGGGGGLQGNVTTSSTGDAGLIGAQGGTGTGGSVAVSLASGSSITTSGIGSHGIFAQSAGGSGSTTSSSDKVTVTVDGDIDVSGAGAHGIVATSTGDGAGKMLVTVTGSVSGGSAAAVDDAQDGIGVLIKGPETSILNNSGTITTEQGTDGTAIYAKDTTLTVNNTGTIVGGIDKASGVILHNRARGTVHGGAVLNVDRVVNNGAFTIGDAGVVGTTQVTGNFRNSAKGTIHVDVDPAAATDISDTLDVVGTATITGTVAPKLINHLPGRAGRQADVIMEGVGDIDLDQVAVTPSAVGQYSLVKIEPGKLHLAYDIDFASESVTTLANDNQTRLAAYFHQLYRGGYMDEAFFNELVALEDDPQYVGSLNTLGMEIVVDTQITTYLSSLGFAERLINCERQSPEDMAKTDGSGCSWIRVGGRHFTQKAKSDNLGFAQDSYEIAGGMSMPFADVWTFGAAASFEQHNITGEDGKGTGEGYQFQLGGALSRDVGGMEYGIYGAFSTSEFDIDRQSASGFNLEGTHRPMTAGLGANVAWSLRSGRMNLRPQIEVGATYLHSNAFQETPDSGYALAVDPHDETIFHVRPSLSFYGDYQNIGRTQSRLFGHVGLTQLLGDATPSASGQFVTMGPQGLDFTAETALDRTRLDLGLGVDILTRKGATLSLNANAGLSETTYDLGAAVQFRIVF